MILSRVIIVLVIALCLLVAGTFLCAKYQRSSWQAALGFVMVMYGALFFAGPITDLFIDGLWQVLSASILAFTFCLPALLLLQRGEDDQELVGDIYEDPPDILTKLP